MLRRFVYLMLLFAVAVGLGCGGCGGAPKGVNQDFDRPKPTPPTTR